MNKKIVIGLTATLAATVLIGCATTTMRDTDLAKKAGDIMRASFETRGQVTVERLNQDEVQQTCTTYSDKNVPQALADKIQKAQLAAVMQPASGKLIGDWKAGERIAQEGRGMQFSDVAGGPTGGNCYACHQLAPQEISFGNLGPSLYNYGKLRGQSKEIVEYTYNKVYNSQAYSMCSNMPRFGHQKILTPEQIADVVGLLLDPASPVNQ